MNREDKIRIVKILIEDYQNLSELHEKVYELFGDSGKMLDAENVMFDHYIEMVSIVIGDNDNWLSWFIFENDCGKRKFEDGYEGKMLTHIKTIEDLVHFIECKVK